MEAAFFCAIVHPIGYKGVSLLCYEADFKVYQFRQLFARLFPTRYGKLTAIGQVEQEVLDLPGTKHVRQSIPSADKCKWPMFGEPG